MFSVFVVCSGLAALVNILVGQLLYGTLGMDGAFSYPVAVSIAFMAGMVVSFVLNRRFTYEASGRPVLAELRDFFGVSLGGLLLTTGIAFVLREMAGPLMGALSGGRVAPENAAHIVAVGLTAFYSFFAHKLVSFRPAGSAPMGEESRVARGPSDVMIVLILLALTLLTRPFRGVTEVGLLYAGQAVQAAGIADLARDPFFAFGNQGSFSVFNSIYAGLIGQTGLTGAAIILWALAMLLWVGALWLLVSQLSTERLERLLMAAAVLLLFPGYGPMNIGYGENLVIPRVFGEAMGMTALALGLAGRFGWSILPLAVGLVLHPIMALVSAAVWLHLWMRSTMFFLGICAFGLLVGIGFGLAGISPFTWLLEPYDPVWFELLHFKNMLVFPLTWEIQALLGLTFPLTMILLTLARSDDGPERRLAYSVLVGALTLVGVSIIGADLLGNRLIAALQPWRVLFLVSLLGNLLFVMRLREMGLKEMSGWLLAMAGLMSMGEAFFRLMPFGSCIMTLLFLLALALRSAVVRRRVLMILFLAAAILTVLAFLSGIWVRSSALGAPPLLAAIFAGMILYGLLARPEARLMAQIPLAVGVVAAVFMADARGVTELRADRLAEHAPELAAELAGQEVYWESGLGDLWLGLGQPSFHSCLQTSGIAFFREQALETRRRAEALRHLNTGDFYPNPGGRCLQRGDPALGGPASIAELQAACAALPELDVIILRQGAADVPGETLDIATDKRTIFGRLRSVGFPDTDRFHMYRCGE